MLSSCARREPGPRRGELHVLGLTVESVVSLTSHDVVWAAHQGLELQASLHQLIWHSRTHGPFVTSVHGGAGLPEIGPRVCCRTPRSWPSDISWL
jgi:hypothetical protein